MSLPGKPFVKLAGILKQIAPTLLAGFGGPAGALVAAIAKKSLGDPTMSDAALQDAVTAATTTPEGLEKLKQIEADLQKAELDYQIKFAELDVEDRASARELAEKTTITPQVILTCLFIAGYFIIFYLFFVHGKDVPTSTEVAVMIGVLTASVTSIMNYWFGSSSGSADKSATIAALAKQS